jgi:exosome complex component RRP42
MRSAAANAYADPQSIESFVRRTIVNSNMINLDQLCILEGKACWKIDVSCTAINHDGNIVDAFILGAVTALMDVELPKIKMEKVQGQEVVTLIEEDMMTMMTGQMGKMGKRLMFAKSCVPLTVGLVQGKMLVDPTLEEESLCDGMITVVVDSMSVKKEKGILTGDVLSISKSGGSVLSSMEEIAACVQLAFGRAKEMNTILNLEPPITK